MQDPINQLDLTDYEARERLRRECDSALERHRGEGFAEKLLGVLDAIDEKDPPPKEEKTPEQIEDEQRRSRPDYPGDPPIPRDVKGEPKGVDEDKDKDGDKDEPTSPHKTTPKGGTDHGHVSEHGHRDRKGSGSQLK